MDGLLAVLAVVALLGSGVIGGVFFAFSSFVMPALGRLPAAVGLAAMQSINVAVLNRHFLGVFVGTAAVSLAVIVVALLQWPRPGTAFCVGGASLYLVGTFLVTGRGNVPLNEVLARLAPGAVDAADAWQRYQRLWTRWNTVRTAAAVLAMLALCIGLLRTCAPQA